MKNRIHIVASGLLLLMLLSVMPKTFLHDLFADHTDISACNDSKITGPCIHKQGFNCQQADLVVPSAYTSSNPSILSDLTFEQLSTLIFSSPVLQKFYSATTGRGPPFHV